MRGKNVFIFVAGVAVGAVSTWFAVKKTYEKIAREEIESVKSEYKKTEGEPVNEEPEQKSDPTYTAAEQRVPSTTLRDYEDVIKENNYTNYSNLSGKQTNDISDDIHIIEPEEFGDLEDEGYDSISLNYFADRVLADDDFNVVEDIAGTVGLDFASHFGEYEDDSVHVRNDAKKCDYEILIDHRRFADILADRRDRR